jgi:hypothetical protein
MVTKGVAEATESSRSLLVFIASCSGRYLIHENRPLHAEVKGEDPVCVRPLLCILHTKTGWDNLH